MKIRLCPWSWILGDDWKNTVKRTNRRDWIFAKSSRCDTSWQGAQVWNPWNPECQTTSPNRDIPAVLVRPCNPEYPRKKLRTKSFRLQSAPTGKRPRWSDYISDLAWSRLGVETTELSEIACGWSWGISGPPRAAAPVNIPKGKAGTKMSEWMSM